MKNLSEARISCTGLASLMTDPQSKADREAGNLSATAKKYLNEVYIRSAYGRRKEIHSKYFEKGIEVEETGIQMYNQFYGLSLVKNDEFLSDDFLVGIPDLVQGPATAAELVADIKSPWDLWTFWKQKTSEIDKDYWWQLQGYMSLTGAKQAHLAYCLIDIPQHLLQDERRKLGYKLHAGPDESAQLIAAMEDLEKNFRYPDIPMEERIWVFSVERDQEAIESIPGKVRKAREYLEMLDKGKRLFVK